MFFFFFLSFPVRSHLCTLITTHFPSCSNNPTSQFTSKWFENPPWCLLFLLFFFFPPPPPHRSFSSWYTNRHKFLPLFLLSYTWVYVQMFREKKLPLERARRAPELQAGCQQAFRFVLFFNASRRSKIPQTLQSNELTQASPRTN